MFSYRHAFHAGNHADVFKHTVLLAILRHLLRKDAALTVVDTHAGAGLYQLDDGYAQTSGEAADGVLKILAAEHSRLAPALQDYRELLASFGLMSAQTPSDAHDDAQADGQAEAQARSNYPGSPMLIQGLLRAHDKLKAFELHPTDSKILAANFLELDAGRQIAMFAEDGFEGVKKFLPPPSRRGLVVTDPSYEIKSDYAKVVAMVSDSLSRFATGTYVVWYPIIPRAEAIDLPRKLKALAAKSGKAWLNATLTVKSASTPAAAFALAGDEPRRAGLPASGMWVLNPPYTLRALLEAALPQMVRILGQDRYAGSTLTSSEG